MNVLNIHLTSLLLAEGGGAYRNHNVVLPSIRSVTSQTKSDRSDFTVGSGLLRVVYVQSSRCPIKDATRCSDMNNWWKFNWPSDWVPVEEKKDEMGVVGKYLTRVILFGCHWCCRCSLTGRGQETFRSEQKRVSLRSRWRFADHRGNPRRRTERDNLRGVVNRPPPLTNAVSPPPPNRFHDSFWIVLAILGQWCRSVNCGEFTDVQHRLRSGGRRFG